MKDEINTGMDEGQDEINTEMAEGQDKIISFVPQRNSSNKKNSSGVQRRSTEEMSSDKSKNSQIEIEKEKKTLRRSLNEISRVKLCSYALTSLIGMSAVGSFLYKQFSDEISKKEAVVSNISQGLENEKTLNNVNSDFNQYLKLPRLLQNKTLDSNLDFNETEDFERYSDLASRTSKIRSEIYARYIVGDLNIDSLNSASSIASVGLNRLRNEYFGREAVDYLDLRVKDEGFKILVESLMFKDLNLKKSYNLESRLDSEFHDGAGIDLGLENKSYGSDILNKEDVDNYISLALSKYLGGDISGLLYGSNENHLDVDDAKVVKYVLNMFPRIEYKMTEQLKKVSASRDYRLVTVPDKIMDYLEHWNDFSRNSDVKNLK